MRHPEDPLVARLRAAGCVYAEQEAALIAAATDDAARREQLVRRRTTGEPLELVLGWAEVGGTRVAVAPGVFVPRARSALLVRLALAALPADGVVVDLGCGTGALGAAVRAARPDAQVWAVDIDPRAVACARSNLPGDRVRLGDLWSALEPDQAGLRGRVDVVLANAPYVPSTAIATMPREARDHEPRVALDGGPDGLDVQRRIARDTPAWLAAGGLLLVETGRPQGPATAAVLRAAGLECTVETDDELGATVVVGRPPTRAAPA